MLPRVQQACDLPYGTQRDTWNATCLGTECTISATVAFDALHGNSVNIRQRVTFEEKGASTTEREAPDAESEARAPGGGRRRIGVTTGLQFQARRSIRPIRYRRGTGREDLRCSETTMAALGAMRKSASFASWMKENSASH